MKEKSLKAWLYVVVFAVVAILLSLLLLTTVQLFKIKALKRDEKKLKDKLNSLIQSEQYYDNANAYVEGDEFIEKYAREVLGLGQEGEEKYNV